MLSNKDKIKIIKKIVQTTSECEYKGDDYDYEANIKSSGDVNITITKRSTINGIDQIIIRLEKHIENLEIEIISSEFYDAHGNLVILGSEYCQTSNKCEAGYLKIILEDRTRIKNLRIKQIGNKEGFSTSDINVEYNPKTCTKVNFSGCMNIKSECWESYSLRMEIC